jgi:hypothetical protein
MMRLFAKPFGFKAYWIMLALIAGQLQAGQPQDSAPASELMEALSPRLRSLLHQSNAGKTNPLAQFWVEVKGN